MFVCAFRR
jgi:protein arginine N-methyltransferase 1